MRAASCQLPTYQRELKNVHELTKVCTYFSSTKIMNLLRYIWGTCAEVLTKFSGPNPNFLIKAIAKIGTNLFSATHAN